jgi:hypothetical protein
MGTGDDQTQERAYSPNLYNPGTKGSRQFQKQLRDQWIQPSGASSLADHQREYHQQQLSSGQEGVRSELVLQALQQSRSQRTHKHIDAIERYLRAARGLAFGSTVPRACMRRLCVAAQVKLHEAGTTVFLAGDPPDDLHVVLGGSLSLHHKIHIAEPPVATEIGAVSESEDENSVPAGHGIVAVIGAGNIADYEDFVGGRLSRRLCATAGEGLLVLRISRGDYEESIQLQLEHEFSERMCALEGCGLFGGVPHKLRGSLAEMLQPRAYRRGATLTRAGEVVNRVILIQQGECVALGRRPGSAGRPAATDISGWRPTSGPRSARLSAPSRGG